MQVFDIVVSVETISCDLHSFADDQDPLPSDYDLRCRFTQHPFQLDRLIVDGMSHPFKCLYVTVPIPATDSLRHLSLTSSLDDVDYVVGALWFSTNSLESFSLVVEVTEGYGEHCTLCFVASRFPHP